MTEQRAGAVAVTNEEAVRAWDTVLYERWKSNRHVFVGALDEVTEEVFERFPPPVGGRCIDIGCGFGDTTQRLAELVGPGGLRARHRFLSAVHRGRPPRGGRGGGRQRRVRDSPTRRRRSGIRSTTTRSHGWGPSSSPHLLSAMRAIRGSLKPGGKLAKVCWRRKAESPFWAETEEVVQRFLSRPEEYDADTCGPGPFSLGNPETTRGILEAAGFDEIELDARDFDYFMGADMDEAIDSLLAIGPGAELIRLNAEYGESRRGRSPTRCETTTPDGSSPTARSSAAGPSGSSPPPTLASAGYLFSSLLSTAAALSR